MLSRWLVCLGGASHTRPSIPVKGAIQLTAYLHVLVETEGRLASSFRRAQSLHSLTLLVEATSFAARLSNPS